MDVIFIFELKGNLTDSIVLNTVLNTREMGEMYTTSSLEQGWAQHDGQP